MDETDRELPFLERWGTRVLRRSAASDISGEVGAIHVLDDDEQVTLRRIERGAVARSAIVGALSALASGITEVFAGIHFGLDHAPTWHDLAAYWGVYGLVTIVASVLEIVYLYWDALRSVGRLASGAGLRLDATSPNARGIASALARTALELPEADRPVFGVDPRRESNRAVLVVASLVYKLKIGLSSFLLKAIVRRALGRLATRQLLAFAAVPVNALWNAAVTYLVLHEARIRVMGPSAVESLLPTLVPDPAGLSDVARRAIVRAAAASIVWSERAHPNLVYLLARALERLGPLEDDVVLDDSELYFDDLRAIADAERDLVLRVAIVAAAIDGTLARPERRWLARSFEIAGRVRDLAPVFAVCSAFAAGREVVVELPPRVATGAV